jgi:hypothetical protein
VQPDTPRFATRLNSFGSNPDAYWPKGRDKPTPLELAERASKADGLTDVDLTIQTIWGPTQSRPAGPFASWASP